MSEIDQQLMQAETDEPKVEAVELLDMAAIERLHQLGGVEFVCSMIDLFFSTTDERLANAQAAMDKGDLETVETATHGLVASAGFIGASQIERLAERIPDEVECGDDNKAKAILDQIADSYQKLKPLLVKVRKTRVAEAPGDN